MQGDDNTTSEEETPADTTGDLGDNLLMMERARDPKANEVTRPPDGEVVTFRSLTLVEMYAGQDVESLKTALSTVEWANFDHSVVDRIVEAQKGDAYSRGVFWFFPESAHVAPLVGHARTALPNGIDRIYSEYYVLGPSLVALVLTFVLEDGEAKRINAALREDAESRIDRRGTSISRKSIQDAKRERLRNIRGDVAQRCRDWINTTMPGTLSGVQDGLGPPTCMLISLWQGTPFQTKALYMGLLGLVNEGLAERFVSPNFLYLAYAVDFEPNNRMVGAFNEAEAMAQHWISDASSAPEVFHEAISSLVIADGIYAVLRLYERKLRGVRDSLNKLDFEKATGSDVMELRSGLLGISRDISTVCSDVTVLVDDPFAIWTDLYPLVPVKAGPETASSESTGELRRRHLRAVVASLQSEETNLRELILVTTAATSEATSLDLQRKVVNLTNTLSTFTVALFIVTVLLVVLGVAALLIQWYHVPLVHLAPTHPTPSTPRHK